MLRKSRIQLKSVDQIRVMRRAGLLVADALDAVRAVIAPGVTTRDLDVVAERVIRGAGGVPSFVGYHGYPATLCVSVNEQVVHGIPGDLRLEAGDIVSVDCGAIVGGWHGDAAFSTIVGGDGAAADRELVEVTRTALWHGIAALGVGERLNVVGAAIEDHVAGRYGLVQDYGGHGIGTAMHQDPHVLNYRTKDKGPRLRPGICLAIEPMLTAGEAETRTLDDGWTVVTEDGRRAAHWEHTVAVHDGGLWVLTARDGGEAELGALAAAAGVESRFAPLGE